ncbi:hypothetical protein C4K22_1877 [Pseudomonas chlororaphis subsp. aurantiaca]|uniref:hypothetical protein n=1 Tax=Pseudomonas chlororaphis TaxID=587753 RepID=UPI000F57E78B|nr:hypothetical protein [Pseudomonas chlororaphis]AZD34630.1 hypothetical protein C4K22_1877 [Pseudomonas chlororaphis subsp. aurantiaca]AZD40965.1 hypothetical protein C4K21_1881 [Pseudomonas chlororaphis subsp. aurantiaca]
MTARNAIVLNQTVLEHGVTWHLFPVDFETPDGFPSVYIYALDRGHAVAVLQELKDTAVLRDGDLISVTPGGKP